MPERAAALDRVRHGDAGILITSPEQLRSVSLRRALDQREISAWVLDEAHCLSRWATISDRITVMWPGSRACAPRFHG